MSLTDRITSLTPYKTVELDLMRMETEAFVLPDCCHGLLDLSPHTDGERRAWCLRVSKLSAKIYKKLATRSLQETLSALQDQAQGYKHLTRTKALDKLEEIWAKHGAVFNV